MEHTFKITISADAHHSWQGVLQTESGVCSFDSELELLQKMATQIDAGEPDCTGWKKDACIDNMSI